MWGLKPSILPTLILKKVNPVRLKLCCSPLHSDLELRLYRSKISTPLAPSSIGCTLEEGFRNELVILEPQNFHLSFKI